MRLFGVCRRALPGVALCLTVAGAASAQTQTFIREYTHRASDADSKLSARAVALDQLKKLLLEEVATYIESSTESDQRTIVLNGHPVSMRVFFSQNISSITAGLAQTRVLDERWDGREYWLKAEIKVDAVEIRRQLARVVEASLASRSSGTAHRRGGDQGTGPGIARTADVDVVLVLRGIADTSLNSVAVARAQARLSARDAGDQPRHGARLLTLTLDVSLRDLPPVYGEPVAAATVAWRLVDARSREHVGSGIISDQRARGTDSLLARETALTAAIDKIAPQIERLP
jgi:hypothetical protein